MLKDPAVSGPQRSKIHEILLPPEADMVRHFRPDRLPAAYLQILESAYGTVQDSEELYTKFMFQDTGEKPCACLHHL